MAVEHPRDIVRPLRPQTVRRLAVAVVVLLGVLATGLMLAQARDDSPTFDEPVYVSAGLLALKQHDLAYNAEHPPIAKAVAAIPVLLTGAQLPPGHVVGANDERTYGAAFLRAQRQAGILDEVTFASRVVPVLLVLVVAVLLGILGHLNGVDLPFALAVVVWAVAMLHARRVSGRRATLLLGAAVGFCLATSMLGLVMVPLTVVVMLVQRRRDALVPALLVVVVAWAVLWASYAVLDLGVLTSPDWLLPGPYVEGLLALPTSDSAPTHGYLLGVAWTGGVWWFWPGSLLVKVTTPVLLVLLLGPVAWRLAERSARRDALVVLAIPAFALVVPLVGSARDLGVRYLLPTFALWCVAASAVVLVLRPAVMMLASVPHSLAYTSPPFTPAYRVATDSNVDWGQDFELLRSWSVGLSPYVDWFGPRGTSYADLPGARDLLAVDPRTVTGWVAVSATNLTSVHADRLSWLRAYCPVGTLGGSVLIYRFDRPPDPAPGPVAPALPCVGDESTRLSAG